MDVKGEGNETSNMVITWKVRGPWAERAPGHQAGVRDAGVGCSPECAKDQKTIGYETGLRSRSAEGGSAVG